MALVLPFLRLWLLLLNIYGTFKSMKPPPQSQRSTRNGQGPSARAMQLRKRELKSRLAVWVVWAMLSTIESPLDRTVGLITPFYHELKCIVLLLLLIARAHAAEAIFLHVIHPLVRPYVPAIDDILTNLHSVFDLFVLLLFLPFEYVSNYWHRWKWFGIMRGSEDKDEPPNVDDGGDDGDGNEGEAELLLEGQRRLRPRNELGQARLRQADRESRAVLDEIDEAQERVRIRTRSQPAAPAIRNSSRNLANHNTRGMEFRPDSSTTVGLRTRKRVLEHPPEGRPHGPGSRSTGYHHIIEGTVLDTLPPVPSSYPFPNLPSAPSAQLVSFPAPTSQAVSTENRSHHEIWYPPRSSYEDRPSTSTDALGRKTPSPIYPPIPSAYPFTPRRSEPLPSPPRVIAPSDLATPTPRRVSTGIIVDGHGGVDRLSNRASPANPSRNTRSAEPSIPRQSDHKDDSIQAEDFFGQALEPSVQAAEMDTDTGLPSIKDDSSANDEDIEMNGDNVVETKPVTELTRRSRNQRVLRSGVREGKRKAMDSGGQLRRSVRTRQTSVETDEFGFTIRPGSTTLGSTTTDSGSSSSAQLSVADPPKKKPLARTKPILKSHQGGDETESSDEESTKKRRKLRPAAAESLFSQPEKFGDDRRQDLEGGGSMSQLGHKGLSTVRGRTKTAPQIKQDLHPARTTRASAKQVGPIKGDRLQTTGAAQKRRGGQE